MSLETFSNDPVTTVLSGGTDAPAAGTTESWTVASSAAFPAASSSASPPQQFHVADPLLLGEVIAVTDLSGATWTVTRGAEGTTPVAHAEGFTVEQVVTAGTYENFVQDATPLSGDLSGTLPSPEVTGITGVAVTGTPAAGAVIYGTSATTAQWTASPPGLLASGNNLTDVASPSTALANLGGAPKASPTLTGVPTTPTAAAGTSNNQVASTAFVSAAVAAGASGSSGTALQKANNLSDVPSASTALANLGAAPASAGTSWYNVKAGYGAKGNGTADDTAAIQAALNAANTAGGGTVYLPAGAYLISSALTVYGYTVIRGDGDEATVIKQSAPAANGLSGTDVTQFRLQDLKLLGPGSGSGTGILFKLSAHQNTGFLQFDSVWVHGFGSDGINIDTPIVSVFNRVVSENNEANGWNIHSSTSATSCTWNSCYGNGNAAAGYLLNTLVYSALNGCAADGNATAYTLTGCQSVVLSGCGAESQTADGYVLSGGYGNTLVSPRTYLNGRYGIHVAGGEKCCTIIGMVDNTPATSAVNCILTDSGTTATVLDCNNTSPNVFNGNTTVLNDGGGDLAMPGAVTAGGTLTLSNGVIKMGASSDTDLYRTAANALATDGSLTTWGSFQVAGGLQTSSMAIKTSAYTLKVSDGVIFGNASSAAFTLTLPAAASGNAGLRFTFVKTDSSTNAVTIAASSSQTINGATSQKLSSQYAKMTLISDGANWWEIA